MWIALLVAVALALLVWILVPILGIRRSWAPREHATVREQLVAERDRLLRALKDLEHESEAGTIAPGDHDEQRRDILAEAAAVYRRLEELGDAEGETA